MADMVPDSGKRIVGSHASVAANSFMLTSRFTRNLITGGQIDVATKNEVLDRMQNNRYANSSGGNVDLHLFAGTRIDSLFGKPTSGLSWFARVRD